VTDSLNLDLPVWGAAAFGRVINRSERQVRHLLRQGWLDCDKCGGLFVSTPRRLLSSFKRYGGANARAA
jgi:hypothetical protein